MLDKKKIITAGEFFDAVVLKYPHSGRDNIKNVYYSILKVIVQELRERGSVRVPDLGDFTLVEHKARMSRNVNSGMLIELPSKKTVKFSPDYKLKKYFRVM